MVYLFCSTPCSFGGGELIYIIDRKRDFMNSIKVATICGSMKFSNEMMKISEELELKRGYAVIQCVYNTEGQKHEGLDGEMLDKIHRKKIDISDTIYVVNMNGYIGSSTKSEIEYAKKLGKEILSLEPLERTN